MRDANPRRTVEEPIPAPRFESSANEPEAEARPLNAGSAQEVLYARDVQLSFGVRQLLRMCPTNHVLPFPRGSESAAVSMFCAVASE